MGNRKRPGAQSEKDREGFHTGHIQGELKFPEHIPALLELVIFKFIIK